MSDIPVQPSPMSPIAAPAATPIRTPVAPSWTLRIVVALVAVSFVGNAFFALMNWLTHS